MSLVELSARSRTMENVRQNGSRPHQLSCQRVESSVAFARGYPDTDCSEYARCTLNRPSHRHRSHQRGQNSIHRHGARGLRARGSFTRGNGENFATACSRSVGLCVNAVEHRHTQEPRYQSITSSRGASFLSWHWKNRISRCFAQLAIRARGTGTIRTGERREVRTTSKSYQLRPQHTCDRSTHSSPWPVPRCPAGSTEPRYG